MLIKSPVTMILEATRHFQEGIQILRAAEQQVWEQENQLKTSLEYSSELEQRADPMNDGFPLIDTKDEKTHAA